MNPMVPFIERRQNRALRDHIDGRIARATAHSALLSESNRPLLEKSRLIDLANLMVRGLDGRILLWSHGAEEEFGFDREEALGQVAHLLLKTVFPTPLETIREKLWRDGKWEGELLHTTKSGTHITSASRWVLNRDDEGQPISILEVNHNITDRKLAEEELTRVVTQLENQKKALDQFAIVAETDAQGCITYANDKFCEVSKYTREELLGRDHRDLVNSGYHSKAFWKEFWDTIKAGRLWRGEIKNRAKDGSIYWLDTAIVPFMGPDGKPEKYLAIRAVITDRKQAEERITELNHELEGKVLERTEQLRRKEQELLQAMKLEAVARLAGGVAHDFNNLITGISGIAEEILLSPQLPESNRNDLRQILEASRRASSLTRQLLAFGQRQTVVPVVLDLNSVIGGLRNMLARLIGENVGLETDLQNSLPAIRADPGQIEQILMNLVINSRDAMPRGGTVTLRTAFRNGQVMLEVSDTGTGMSEATKARAFEPFFTTKPQGQGSGLGLASVHGIVKQNGGHIQLESKLGFGTSFRIYFPPTEEKASADRRLEPREMPRGHETILLAEDEGIVRQVVTHALTRLGYHVLAASGADEALRLAGRESAVDLLLSDVVMPGLSGTDLAERLVRERPEISVLLMSGYAPDAVMDRHLLDPRIAFIEKPFTTEKLARRVRDALDARELRA